MARAWDAEASAYQTIITLTAVSLFFFGLSLTLEGCLRWVFVGLGALNIGVIGLWAFILVIFPIRPTPEAAITAYAEGNLATAQAFEYEYFSLHPDAIRLSDQAITELSRAIEEHDKYVNAYIYRGDAHLIRGEALLLMGGDAIAARAALDNAVADYQAAIALGDAGYHTLWNLGWAYYLLGRYDDSIAAYDAVLVAAPQQQLGARVERSFNFLGLRQPEAAMAEVRAAARQAAANPASDDIVYFRQSIRNLERLRNVFRHPGMDEMILLLKESLASIQSLGQAEPAPTTATITNPTFVGLLPDGSRREDVTFPTGTSQVFLRFDFAGLAGGEPLMMKVYWEGQEQPYMNEVLVWPGGEAVPSQELVIQATVDPSYLALSPGLYQVDLFVSGNLLATSSFRVSQ
jgi:tetratricopeptide (TPR) repeat protein